MVDKINKALKKLKNTEKKQIKLILEKIKKGDLKNLDLKKLKGYSDIFRIRKGKIRIIYKVTSDQKIYILAIEKRSNRTYKL